MTFKLLFAIVTQMNHQIPSIYRAALLVLVGILFLGVTPAKASTVLIDFTAGTSPAGSTPTTGGLQWNNVNTGITTSLVGSYSLIDTTGASFGTMTFASGSNWATNNSNTGYTVGAVGNFPVTATADFLFINNNAGITTATFTLTGLDTTGTVQYNFTWLSSRAAADVSGRPITMTFTGANSGFATENATLSPSSAGNSTTQTVSGIIASPTGTITVTSQNTAAQFAYLNAMQIDAVPEPSAAALSILGGLGLFVVVIRRRQLAQV